MYKISTIILLLLMSIGVTAQEEQKEIQTLFGDKKGSGGYLGVNMKIGEVDGKEALFTGGELAFVANRSLNIGVEGYGLVSHVLSDDLTDTKEKLYIEMGYGGLHIEPVIHSEGLIHLTVPVLLGAGGIGQTTQPVWTEEDGEVTVDFDSRYHESDFFLVAEPGLDLELNVFKFMRVAAGASYRFTSNIEVGSLDRNDITGWNANVSLRIGWF